MKTYILLPLFFSLFINVTNAQDYIYQKNGDTTKALVTEITQNAVKFKMYTDPSGVSYIIDKIDIIKIAYENGTFLDFTEKVLSKTDSLVYDDYIVKKDDKTLPNLNINTEKLFIKGQQDARIFYDVNNSAKIGAFCIGVGCGAIGAIGILGINSAKPKDISNSTNIKNENYLNGYEKGAFKKKKKEVWFSFLGGVAVAVISNIIFFVYLQGI